MPTLYIRFYYYIVWVARWEALDEPKYPEYNNDWQLLSGLSWWKLCIREPNDPRLLPLHNWEYIL